MECIVAMGVDVEQVDRFGRHPSELFTEAEVAYCMAQGDAAEAFAGTWCAKEVVVKALGDHVTLLPRYIEVTRNANGAPHAQIRTSIRPAGGGTSGSTPAVQPVLHMSITHAGGLAVAAAAAVLEDMAEGGVP